MFYKIVKLWANISFRFYFRRIFVSGTEHIPKKGAVLFIVNHPNSFLEACLVACVQHRDLHFLVRGDMFEKKWLKPILRWTNQIPIFRFRDGYVKMKQNISTFDASFKVLAEKNALLIFPEASTIMVKYLRPLQKGAARLVLGAIEEYNVDELFVIPTGVYYSEPTKARSDVIIRFGQALEMRKWLSTCNENVDKLTEITQAFEKHMDKVVISINPDQDVKEFDRICDLAEPKLLPYLETKPITNEDAFERMKIFSKNYQKLNKHDHHEARRILGDYIKSWSSIKALNFKLTKELFKKGMLLLKIFILFFLGLPGMIFYGIPFVLIKRFAKNKIQHIEFYAPVRLALSMFVHVLISIALWCIVANFTGIFWGLLSILILQGSVYSFMLYLDLIPYSTYSFTRITHEERSKKLKILHHIEKIFSL